MIHPRFRSTTAVVAAVTLLALTVAGLALAKPQHSGKGPMPPEQRLERLEKLLDQIKLSEEQADKIHTLLANAQSQHAAVLARYGLTDEKFHTMNEELRQGAQATREGLDAILTCEQREELRDLMGGPRSHHHGPHDESADHQPPPDGM